MHVIVSYCIQSVTLVVHGYIYIYIYYCSAVLRIIFEMAVITLDEVAFRKKQIYSVKKRDIIQFLVYRQPIVHKLPPRWPWKPLVKNVLW